MNFMHFETRKYLNKGSVLTKLYSKWRTLSGIMFIIIAWEVAATALKIYSPRANMILPSLEYIFIVSLPGFASFSKEMVSSSPGQRYLMAILVILDHLSITALRVFGGTLSGVLVGVGLGILMGWSQTFRRVFEPSLHFIRQAPLLALIPLFLIWFGGTETSRYMYVMFGIFIILVVNTLNAIRNIPPVYGQFGQTLGASRGQVFRKIIVPAILPEVLGGIRMGFALGWAMTLGAEYIAAQKGLGRIMVLSEYFMYTGRMIIIVFLFMLFAFIVDRVIVYIFNKWLRWMP